MKQRLYAHRANLSTAVAAARLLPKYREAAIAITHLENASLLIDETLALLEGTEDAEGTAVLEGRSISTYDSLATNTWEYLETEKRALKDTALCCVTASQDQRADVLFAQSVFTEARINVALAARRISEIIKM